jgi:hypothetical protein
VSAEPVGEPLELVPGLEWSLLDAGALGVLDALLGGVSVDHSPADGARQCLAECLGGFEAVPVADRHPPGRNLRRLQLADRGVPERGGGFAKQPAELVDCLGLGVMLGEVDRYELAQRGCLSEVLFLPGALERAVECLLGGSLGPEAASLRALSRGRRADTCTPSSRRLWRTPVRAALLTSSSLVELGYQRRSGAVDGDRSRQRGEVALTEIADVFSVIAIRELSVMCCLTIPLITAICGRSNPRSISSHSVPLSSRQKSR